MKSPSGTYTYDLMEYRKGVQKESGTKDIKTSLFVSDTDEKESPEKGSLL